MKSNILPAITSLLLVFLSSPMVRSQDTYPDVSMKVDLVAWGDGISGLSIGASANKAHTVSALPFSYSKAVTYSGPSMLEISQSNVTEVEAFKGDIPDDVSVPIAPEESAKKAEKLAVPPLLLEMRKKKPDLVALATLPVGSKRATVLLGPGPDHTFQTFVIDDDPTKLPFGKVRIHNLSSAHISINRKDSKPIGLRPKESAVAEPLNHYIFYELAYKEDKEWKVLKTDMLRVADDEQVQMVVLKSSNKYFMSSDGSMGGSLQVVVLRRTKEPAPIR